jgi:hypothetical protein
VQKENATMAGNNIDAADLVTMDELGPGSIGGTRGGFYRRAKRY